MSRLSVALSFAVLLASCASTPKSDEPLAGVLPNPVVDYRCESGEPITVRIDGPSAALRYNGVDYTLPQLSTAAGVLVFSDGRHVIEVRQERLFFGLGRSIPRLCIAQ